MSTMFREKVGKYLLNYKILLVPLLLLVIALFVANLFIDKHTAYLTGEQVFSFDYIGHIKNITHDFDVDRSAWLRTNDCLGCPDFYHYSRWYSLVNLSIFSIGKLLHVHPFLFYIFLTISVQLLAIYISLRLLFQKVQGFSFFIASGVFIALPVNFSYLGSGLYSFHHAFLLLSLSLVVYVLRNIEETSFKRVVQWGVLTGIAGSFFLNVSIGFLPIFLYSFLGVLAFFYKKLIRFWKKIVCFSVTTMGLVGLLNFPIVLSVLLHGNPRDFFAYHKLSLLDSFTAGVTLAPAHLQATAPIFVVVFFFAIITLLIKSNLSRKSVLFLASFYSFIAILLSGDIVYDFVFHHFPLMGSLRSLHRLIVFEEIVLLFVVYMGLTTLLSTGRLLNKYLAAFLSFILIVIPCSFIKNNFGYLNKISVPEEYFQADEYLSGNFDKKIYFPAYLPFGQGINNNYTWSQNNALQGTLYQNPFSSIFAVPNLVMFERYPVVTEKQMEMRALLDYGNDTGKIVKAMKDSGIQYVILDRNFLWQKNFPTFDYAGMVSRLILVKSFGNIDVYQVEPSTKKCKKSYGEYAYGFCHVEKGEKPDYLLNTNKKEYLIETYEPEEDEYMQLLAKENVYPYVSDPSLQMFLMNKKVAYSDVLTMDNQQGDLDENLFDKKMNSGRYMLVLPLMRTSMEQEFFKKSVLQVHVDDAKVASLKPKGARSELAYEMIPFDLENEGVVSVRIKGDGYFVMKKPYILEREKYESIIDNKEWQPNIINDSL